MNHLKRAVLITAAISLALFAACGGGGSSNNNNNNSAIESAFHERDEYEKAATTPAAYAEIGVAVFEFVPLELRAWTRV